MIIPDKVYIPYEIGPGYDYISSYYYLGPTPKMENAEYIRKDALLEYLTERRKGLSSGDSFVAGERKMLKEIIEKIESL